MHMKFRDARAPASFAYVPGPAKRAPPVPGEYDPRRAYQKARYIWMSFSEAEKQIWKDAIKRSGMSGYDVWMRGALYNFAREKYAPNAPNASQGCYRGCRGKPKPPPHKPPDEGDVWQPPRLDEVWFNPARDCNFGVNLVKTPEDPPWLPPPLGADCGSCSGYTPSYLIVNFQTLHRGWAPPGEDNEWSPLCVFHEFGIFTVAQFPFEPCFYIEMIDDAICYLDMAWTPTLHFESPSRGDAVWTDEDCPGGLLDCVARRRLDIVSCGAAEGDERCPNYEDCHISLFPSNPEGDP